METKESDPSQTSVQFSQSDAFNPIKKKIDALIASNLQDNQDFIDMFNYVAPSAEELDIHIERRFMRKIEDRIIAANREYLSEVEKINGSVQRYAEKVRKLDRICQGLTEKIQTNQEKTQDLLRKTADLQKRKKELEERQKVISEFLDRCSLTAEEESALKGSPKDGSVDSRFFAALNRMKDIHNFSKELLKSGGEHAAALGVMEEMASKMDQAYEVLFRSIQRECRLLNVDFAELKGSLVQSIAATQDREVLFKYALDEYSSSRRSHIVKAYIDALTRGGVGGTPKPIELLSHDPLRYVGDMLAWIHQAMATERELLQALFRMCDPDALKNNGERIQTQIAEVLCRPFKVRVEQALSDESNCVVLYRLSCLFTFYGNTFAQSMDKDALLLLTINELKELTLTMFFSVLNSSVQKFLGKMGTPTYDLLPVQPVQQVLLLLRDVLESHDGTIADVGDKKENFSKIFAAVLNPLNQAIQLSAAQLHSPLDVAVYTLNCLSTINSVIILYQYTDEQIEKIKAQMEANEDVLVSEEATAILSETDLLDIYNKAAAHQPNQGPLSEISGAEPARVSSALSLFDSLLSNFESFRLGCCAKISSVRVRESIEKRTVSNVVAAYSKIYEKLVDPANKFPDFGLKTPDQVIELLSWN